MAQWNGQYTGNSHATKIKDLEETLTHAVFVFREAGSAEEIQAKGKSVRKLAEKLLNARLKFLKAKIYDAEPVSERDEAKRAVQIENLRQHEAKARHDGINGILNEFKVADLIE